MNGSRPDPALHEAAHVAAAALIGRRVDGVAIHADGGAAWIASLNTVDPIPSTVTLEQVLDDLTLAVAGNEVNRVLLRAPSLIDEDNAGDLAHRATASPDEAVALVELGRMRARTLTASPVFVRLVERVADELLAHDGELNGNQVTAILNDERATNGKA